MIFRGHCLASLLVAVLSSSLLHAQFAFPPRTHKDMEAQLTVTVAKETPERGRGEATLTLAITGPDTLEVEPPRLGDAAAAWKEERLAETRTVEGNRVKWEQVIRLKQVKPGLEPLADLSVRFRRGREVDWIEEKWIDILRHVHAPPPSALEEEEPSWLSRWGFVLILAATALLVLLAWLGKRRGIRLEMPLPPDRWALREIERIETTLLPPRGEAETFHTQMSYVVRRYWAERFGVQALQQTTAEFLEAVRNIPQVPAGQPAVLIELFQRCDLAKFARAGAAPEECRRTAELARDLVRQTCELASRER